MKVERLHLRLFLEGVEVPVVSATVTMSRDTPAQASIQIVPTSIAYLILPRTLVHLFFTDDTFPDYLVTNPAAGGQYTQPTTTFQTPNVGTAEPVVPDVPVEYTRYRLMFVGEVLAVQWVKNKGNRAVILVCQDCSNYWDSVMHDVRGGLFPPTRMPRFAGEASGAFYDLLGGETGAIYDKLSTPPSAFPHLSIEEEDPVTHRRRRKASFMAGVMHLMEEVYGTYHYRLNGERIITSANPFAAMAELRLRLLQQIAVPPGDSTPLRLMQSQGFGSIWRRGIRGLPRQFNFRMLMQALMQYTFYSVYPLSTPSYQPPTGDYAKMMGWARLTEPVQTNPPMTPDMRSQVDWMKTRAEALRDRFDVGGANNRVPVSDIKGFFRSVKSKANSLRGSIDDYTAQTLNFQAVRSGLKVIGLEAAEGAAETDRQAATAQGGGGQLLGTNSWDDRSRGEGITVARYRPLVQFVENIISWCDDVLGHLGAHSSARRDRDTTAGTPALLYTQFFRPDIWFCPPPRCNVLFPEHIVSISGARNFMTEPTRLMIRKFDQLMGSDTFFDSWYFAPTAVGLLRERTIVRQSGGTVAGGDAGIISDLMAHEIYTGILPSFQKMSDVEMAIGKNVLGAGGSSDEISGEKLDYFQRVTNYLFFKTRFAARTLSVDCRFNPYVVPGFPGLIVDAPTDSIDTSNNQLILRVAEQEFDRIVQEQGLSTTSGEEAVRAQRGEILDLLKGRTGVHWMGMIESVTHSLVANGAGGTTIALSYARDHREKTEFFGSDIVEARRRRKIYREIRRRITTNERDTYVNIADANLQAASQFQQQERAMIGGALSELREQIGTGADVNMGSVEAYQASARAYDSMSKASMSVAEYLLNVVREGTVPGQELATTKMWTVACFEWNPPQVGGTGPWGGPIKESRDVTDQFVSQVTRSPASDQELRAIADQLETLEEMRTEAQRELQSSSMELAGTAPISTAEGEVNTLNSQISALEARRSGLQSRVAVRARRLSLYGNYGTGARLPAASIPPHYIGTATAARLLGPEVVSAVGDPNAMVTLKAYEIIEDISQGADKIDFPVEEVVCPPWFPDVWKNGKIGGGVYLPLLGTGAITDPIAILTPGTLGDLPGLSAGAITTLFQDAAAGVDQSAQVIGSIMDGASVQGAVDFLVHTYSLMREQGIDITEFVKDYCWRPIATLFDLFGSRDLKLKSDGTIEQGVEGFHSRSFGPYADLFGLAPGDTSKLLGITEDDVAGRARLDVRGRRHTVILAYRDELQARRITRG